MSDARKLKPKPGQHFGKRVRRPKHTPKRTKSNAVAFTREPLAEWERELLYGNYGRANVRRARR